MKEGFLYLGLAVLSCDGIAAAKAAISTTSPAWNPNDTAPMIADVASAAAHTRAIHFRTPSCKAIITINAMIKIGTFEDGDANGIAALDVGNRPKIAGRRLDRVLLNHHDLYRPVCAVGANLISRFRLTPGIYEMDVPVQLLLNAVDMDLRDHGHCAQDLLAALPKTRANDQVRINAQSLCDSDYENHDRPTAACDVLIQGLKTGER